MKAKLQKQQAYKYKGKTHFKHVIVVPDEAIAQLGWQGGQGLEVTVNDGLLIFEKTKSLTVQQAEQERVKQPNTEERANDKC
jgi:antitoxin component of MazEF toxin-antitoxin module